MLGKGIKGQNCDMIWKQRARLNTQLKETIDKWLDQIIANRRYNWIILLSTGILTDYKRSLLCKGI